MIGPHVQGAGRLSPDGWDFCQRAGIVKAIDDPSPLMMARPGAVTVFRAFVPDDQKDAWSPRAFLDLTLHRLKGFRPTYIESQNEWRAKLSEGLSEHITWLTEFVKLAHAAGYRVCGFNFPQGTPDGADWQAVKEAGFCNCDVIGLHEYWGDQGFSTWRALRYRRAHEFLEMLGAGNHRKFCITEAGRDAVEGFERIEGVREGRPGWKLQGVSAEQYAAEIAAYDAEISRDPYVLGAVIFTAGAAPDWAAFSIDDIIHLLPASEPAPVEATNMRTVKIGNLDVEDLRPDLPDESGKMPSVGFVTKDFISVHHTVTGLGTSAKAIYDYHKSKGWGGIGYNFLVYADGSIQYVGECNTARAAVGQIAQGNRRGVHIAFVDDLSSKAPTEAARAACKKLIANLQHAYGWFIPVVPHRLFNCNSQWDTDCPGHLWRSWWKDIIRAVGE